MLPGAAKHQRDQQRDQHEADDAGEHQRLKLRVLPLVRLENVPPAGADRAGLGMLRRVDDHLILFLGDRDDRLALRAGALLAGEFVGHAEPLQAAGAGDVDRHGGEERGARSEERVESASFVLACSLLLLPALTFPSARLR